jgi:hypothetical protein
MDELVDGEEVQGQVTPRCCVQHGHREHRRQQWDQQAACRCQVNVMRESLNGHLQPHWDVLHNMHKVRRTASCVQVFNKSSSHVNSCMACTAGGRLW